MEKTSAAEPELVLALDVGTQSLRAMAFDALGRMVDGIQLACDPPYLSPEPNWAEQDPDYYLLKMGEACRKLWSQGKVSPGGLAGLALTCQRSTLVNLDHDGAPLRPAILWLDQRRAGNLPRLPLYWRLLFYSSGLISTVRHLMAEAKDQLDQGAPAPHFRSIAARLPAVRIPQLQAHRGAGRLLGQPGGLPAL